MPTADFVVGVGGSPTLHYTINGSNSPTLSLVAGQTYSFDLTAFGDEHPFLINSHATDPFGLLFLPSSSGAVVNFTPLANMPPTVYYHCSVHYGSMVGTIQISGTQPCSGDLNADYQVNSFDFGLFVNAFGTSCSGCSADMNNNGTVNSFDFGLFINAYGAGC